jgi:carbon-monoxide dehydrogenase small subunit/xanthine dehydrogenase small subunit
MDGLAVNSCMILAYQARDRSILTIEGLGQEGKLDPLQESFVQNGAIQCGYCTPGMILAAKALLMQIPHPTEAEIREGIAGNLCRCTGYVNIVKAIKAVAERDQKTLFPRESKEGLGLIEKSLKGNGIIPFNLKGVHRLADVIDAQRCFNGKIAFIAGGTDMINTVRERGLDADLMIDLSQVEDLKYIREEAGMIRIGAGTTFSEIAASSLVRAKAPCLAQAAAQIGSVQIRNRATIGGNIAGASPAADSLPALVLLNAALVAIGPRGERQISVEESAADVWKSALSPNELIKEIFFPIPGEDCVSGFQKVGSRGHVTIARLNMAMQVRVNARERIIEEGKIVLGTLGKKPFWPEKTSSFLSGKKVDLQLVNDLALLLSKDVAEKLRRDLPGHIKWRRSEA